MKNTDTINIAPHGECNIVEEHGREWAVCNPCGATWALDGSNLEPVSDGDGSCEEADYDSCSCSRGGSAMFCDGPHKEA